MREIGDFDISVAAYPDYHPEAPNAAFDLLNLQRKIDAGGSRAITQFFFDTDRFLRFRDFCVDLGITESIVPGILPINKYPQLMRFANACGATVPDWVGERFEGLDDDEDTRRMISANIAIEMCQKLQSEGVNEFHFYTLNRAELTYAICHALGIRAAE